MVCLHRDSLGPLCVRSLTEAPFRPPNRGRGRRIQPGQKIHISVLKFMERNPDYKPAAELNNGYTWDDIRALRLDTYPREKSALFVEDLYSSAMDILAGLQRITEGPEESQITRRHTNVLDRFASSC